MTKELERLQKRIANSGYTSRRKAETLISEGKVKVNGTTVTELGIGRASCRERVFRAV